MQMISPEILNNPFEGKEDLTIVVDINSLEDAIAPTPGEVMSAYIGFVRAYHLWMHGAHNVTKGPSFAGDHEILYGRIYTEVAGQIDQVIEKSMCVYDDESIACPMRILDSALLAMEKWESPADQPSGRIAELALIYTKQLVKIGEGTSAVLKEMDQLTYGTDNMMAGLADLHEGYVYLLNQRNKN